MSHFLGMIVCVKNYVKPLNEKLYDHVLYCTRLTILVKFQVRKGCACISAFFLTGWELESLERDWELSPSVNPYG
jgi:hypothetical protein